MFRSWRVCRPEEAVSDHIPRGLELACFVDGGFIMPRGRFRFGGRVDRSPPVPQLAGSSPRRRGFASYLLWVVARVFHSWQVYRPEEAVSDYISRGS